MKNAQQPQRLEPVGEILFNTWLDDLQLYLQSNSRDSVSLFDHTSGAAPAPPATAESATRSQWLTRDTAARLAIRNHLPPPSRVPCHEPTPDVGATSASGKRRSSKGKGGRGGGGGSGGGGGGSAGGGGGSGGGGGGGSGGGSGGFGGGGGGTSGGGSSGGSGGGGGRARATQQGGAGSGERQQQQRRSETTSPQQLREWFSQRGASGGSGSCPYVIRTGDRAGQTCGKPHTQHRYFSRLDDAWRSEFGDEAERPRWAELLRYGVAIFDLDYDAILAAMYALSVSAEGDCYVCVPPDPGIQGATPGASESTLPGTATAKALHTFTLDSGASCCFFRDSTTLTPLSVSKLVRLAYPSGGPVLAHSSTVLPCLAVRSGSLSGLHLPSFSTNLVSIAALQDAMVTTTTPGGHRVSICTCTWTGRHLATFTRRPGSSLYTLATKPPQVAASAHVSASEGWQRAAPHSSFPPTSAPLQTLHMDVWGPARISGQSRERYFLLSVSSYASCSARTLLSYVCTLTKVASSPPLAKNGIAEHRIGLAMEVARTSMIDAAAPRYAAHQLNLRPRVSFPETSPTLRWTGQVGDASVFRVVTFDESVPFYRLFPYRSTPPPPPPLFLAPGPPPLDPLPPQGPAPSGVSQVDPLPCTVSVEVAVSSGAARGAAPGGAEPGGAKSEGAGSGGVEPGGVEPGGAEPAGVEPGGAKFEGAESEGAEPRGTASSGDLAGV
ncbi:unnamed protein product [Closterium sp. NIES-54]